MAIESGTRAFSRLELFALQLGASVEGFAVVAAIWLIRPLRVDLGAAIVWDSLLLGIYPAIAAISGFFWAEEMNKRGRKWTLLACYLLSTASWFLLLVPNLWCMLLARVLQGASVPHLQGIAFTMVEDRTTGEDEATGTMSAIAAGYGFGFIFSSALLLVIQRSVSNSIAGDRIALGLLGFATIAITWFVQVHLSESREGRGSIRDDRILASGLQDTWTAARDMFGAGSIFLLVVLYLMYGNTVAIDSTLGELGEWRYGWGTEENAVLSLAIGATISTAQFSLAKILSRYRERQIAIACALVLIVTTVAIAFPLDVGVFDAAVLCKTVGYAALIPLLNQYVAQAGEAQLTPQRVELAVSTKESAVALSSFIGKWLLQFGAGGPAVFGTVAIAVGFAVLVLNRQKLRELDRELASGLHEQN